MYKIQCVTKEILYLTLLTYFYFYIYLSNTITGIYIIHIIYTYSVWLTTRLINNTITQLQHQYNTCQLCN